MNMKIGQNSATPLSSSALADNASAIPQSETIVVVFTDKGAFQICLGDREHRQQVKAELLSSQAMQPIAKEHGQPHFGATTGEQKALAQANLKAMPFPLPGSR